MSDSSGEDASPREIRQESSTTGEAEMKLKVNTDKPIDEVHPALKEMDSRARSERTDIVWQNIVG